MKKNIVLLIPQLKFGGAERVVSRLSFALREKYNLMIVVFDGENVTYEIGCTLKSLDIPPTLKGNIFMKTINVFRRILEYRKFKRDNNIDLTYSFGDTANIVNVFSFGKDKKISSVRGFKRIRTNDGFLNRYIKKPISKNVLAKSDKVISVSELITKTIVQEYNIDEKKVETIYNGYESNEIILKSQENLSNEEHKTFSEEKILISAGTFRSEKGYWHLLKAFSLVLKKEKNAKLVILGRDYK